MNKVQFPRYWLRFVAGPVPPGLQAPTAAKRLARRLPRCARTASAPGRGTLRIAARTLTAVAAVILTLASGAHAQSYGSLVQNTGQPAESDTAVLGASQHGLNQGFRTGPHEGGYELTAIRLYVGRTHGARSMTVAAGLYRGDRDDLSHARLTKVAELSGGSLDDHAYNEWRPPSNTYMDANAHYYIALECTAGCTGDSVAAFGMTASNGEDAGAESGWSVHDRLAYRKAGASKWKLDTDKALRIQVRGRPSPYRALQAEIISIPADGHTYRYGESIDILLTFNTTVAAVLGETFIGIRVGDATNGSNYRAAPVVAGSGSKRLRFRYEVRVDDADPTGISVDDGGPVSGFSGVLPTQFYSFEHIPVSRYYPGLPDDDAHKVGPAVRASFEADTYTASEDGTAATVTVVLDAGPAHDVIIPVAAAPIHGASADDYTLSADRLHFAVGETAKSFTVTANDDTQDDDGEGVRLSFGTLPRGVAPGERTTAAVTLADNDGDAAGRTVTIRAQRNLFITALDDVIFNLSLAEAPDEAVSVAVRLTQDRAFLPPGGLERRVELPAHTTAVELRIDASEPDPAITRDGTLTATLLQGAGYVIGSPAAASVRMVGTSPALVARLGRSLYRFEEGGAEARVNVIMETQPGVPRPNRPHEVTVSAADGTALSGEDYVFAARSVTFAPEAFTSDGGRWIARRTLEVPVTDDGDDEASEYFHLRLARDGASDDRIEVRNPEGTACEGPCQARIVIVDNDEVGVTFLDSDGNPLDGLRLSVGEGGDITYFLKLNGRPHSSVIVAREPGDGDTDLVLVGEASWAYSPQDALSVPDDHHWQEPFPVAVQAQQDDDVYSGQRNVRHYLLRDGERVDLPDVVLVELDDEADGPLRIFGMPRVVSTPASGDAYDTGERIELRVTFTQPVRVTGNPYLEFEVGSPDAGAKVRASLTAGDGTHDLLFAYTVEQNDRDADGIDIGASAVALNDGAIQGIANGEDASLDHAAPRLQTGHKVRGPATLSVADARAEEGADATLDFVVTLSRPVDEPVTVDYATVDGTAVAGNDYVAASGTLTFEAGETEKTVSVAVRDGALDEGEETLTLQLSNASGARIEDAEATGIIENTDLIPKAWLARFGRSVAQHVLYGVVDRLAAPRRPGMRATLAGHVVGGAGDPAVAQETFRALGERHMDSPGAGVRLQPESLTYRDVLTGSAFALSGNTGGGSGAVWGRGAYSGFDAEVDGLALGGTVATALLGADYAVERWVAGLSLSHSRGDGTWRTAGRGEAGIASSLTGLYPYLGYDVSDRLSLWGVTGYGQGDLSLTLSDGASYRTDLRLTMAAVGARAGLIDGTQPGRPSLVFESDALLVRTTSDAASGPVGLVAAAKADVSRLRLGVEGSLDLMLAGGGLLGPTVEVALRRDGGDAETGFGVEVGGALTFADAARGMWVEVNVRALVAHEASAFRDWGVSGSLRYDPTPSSDRGPSASLTPSWASSASGGAAALWGRETLAGLTAGDASIAGGRIDAEAAYGLAAFGGRSTGTPYLGAALSEVAREVRVGYRLELLRREGLTLGIEGTQRESLIGASSPEHGVMLNLALR